MGWSVEKAAERFGIEPAHVRRVESGRTNPSLATLVGIAHGLSPDVVELLGERVERLPTKTRKQWSRGVVGPTTRSRWAARTR
jgi:transcriptional regulator with XRE-family HTH domain